MMQLHDETNGFTEEERDSDKLRTGVGQLIGEPPSNCVPIIRNTPTARVIAPGRFHFK